MKQKIILLIFIFLSQHIKSLPEPTAITIIPQLALLNEHLQALAESMPTAQMDLEQFILATLSKYPAIKQLFNEKMIGFLSATEKTQETLFALNLIVEKRLKGARKILASQFQFDNINTKEKPLKINEIKAQYAKFEEKIKSTKAKIEKLTKLKLFEECKDIIDKNDLTSDSYRQNIIFQERSIALQLQNGIQNDSISFYGLEHAILSINFRASELSKQSVTELDHLIKTIEDNIQYRRTVTSKEAKREKTEIICKNLAELNKNFQYYTGIVDVYKIILDSAEVLLDKIKDAKKRQEEIKDNYAEALLLQLLNEYNEYPDITTLMAFKELLRALPVDKQKPYQDTYQTIKKIHAQYTKYIKEAEIFNELSEDFLKIEKNKTSFVNKVSKVIDLCISDIEKATAIPESTRKFWIENLSAKKKKFAAKTESNEERLRRELNARKKAMYGDEDED
ncbi:MAG: hypothetical protein WC707_00365 [Candidatus Babeliaceae bacterium]|jgi:hypothetical protein